MFRHFRFLLLCSLAARVFAAPVSVTLNGNFGAPTGGSSILDNQNYSVTYTIPNPASPDAVTCCLANISAEYDVIAHLAIPGLGVSIDNAVQVQYENQLPMGQWLNIFTFTGLPVGDFMVLTPFQLTSGELWNGLAGSLGTPQINLLDHAAGTGVWHLEQNMADGGPLPIAVYSGDMNFNADPVPEPGSTWIVALAVGLVLTKSALWHNSR